MTTKKLYNLTFSCAGDPGTFDDNPPEDVAMMLSDIVKEVTSISLHNCYVSVEKLTDAIVLKKVSLTAEEFSKIISADFGRSGDIYGELVEGATNDSTH